MSNMKKLGRLLTFPFIYFLLLNSSPFLLKGVFSDATEPNESNSDSGLAETSEATVTLDVSNTASDNAELKGAESLEKDEINFQPFTESNIEVDLSSTGESEVPKPKFSDAVSQNAGVSNEIINNDTPIVISSIDIATEELQQQASKVSLFASENTQLPDENQKETNATTKPLTHTEEDRSETDPTATKTETEKPLNIKNATDSTEDIPSFSEWAQKQLEEVEKKEQANFSTPSQSVNNTKQGSSAKLRWKNYASVDCGAKVILANAEAQNAWAVLSPSRDEYKLDPCNSRIWFIVELCEAIQVKKIDLANYELFSSSPKEFVLSVADRFPTRDWSIVGQYTAEDERDVQSFDVHTETFGKYIKIEVKSHYGSEHYCPLSLFRAYGTSVFEVLQKDDPAHQPPEEDDDDETLDHAVKADKPSNLLSSATDAVLSMVKKAAEVLGNKHKTNESSSQESTKTIAHIMKSCSSPSHYVVCNNCSDMLFGKVFELLSCRQRQVKNLVSIPYIRKCLVNSLICQRFGFDLRNRKAKSTVNICPDCVESFFPQQYLGAMCNYLAIAYNKVLYNISHQYFNTTENMPKANLENIEKDQPKAIPPLVVESTIRDDLENVLKPDQLDFHPVDHVDINTKPSCSTDTFYTSQIKSTRTLDPSSLDSEQSDNAVISENKEESTQKVYVEQPKVPAEVYSPSIEPSVVESSTEVVPDVPVPETTESSIDDNIDKLMTELNSEPAPSVINSMPTAGQKESVFLRLSNRIKALERNMSLSGQYLEELSKRYKKQVEEMQRVLERTEQTLNDVTKNNEERQKQLEERLDHLTTIVESLLAENSNWESTSYWLFLVVGVLSFLYCFHRISAPKHAPAGDPKPVEVQRRNSVDTVARTVVKKKKRRPSDQALKIVASASSGDIERQSKKRKKKSSNPESYTTATNGKFSPKCTSSKIWHSKSNGDWVEGRQVVEDIPFPLEEPDTSTLEAFTEPPEISKIEAPPFLKTATYLRLDRVSFKNGKNLEQGRIEQPSPTPSNGSTSSGVEQTPKKEKKGIKKLFKKVF